MSQNRPATDGFAAGYPPPRHNVLLLSCMDVRLLDQLMGFMERDNLTNRYDHLILAGASLGVMQTQFPSWKETFFQHVEIALKLHQPEDVYIVEHRNCGAYREFLGLDFGDTAAEQKRETDAHCEHAFALKREIESWCAKQSKAKGKRVHLNVNCFLMDLRGGIELLQPTEAKSKPKKASAPRKK